MTITSVVNHGNNIRQKIGNNICLMSIIIHGGLNIYHQWQYHQPFTHILWVKTFFHTPSGVTKFAGKTFSSGLRKLTAVSKSFSKSKLFILLLRKLFVTYLFHLICTKSLEDNLKQFCNDKYLIQT